MPARSHAQEQAIRLESETAPNGRAAAGRPPVLIRLRDLSKAYVEAGTRHPVLESIDWSFQAGDFICLLGKSGSGKSTLLNLISGIDAPSAGQVFIQENGREIDLTGLNEHERTLFRRRHIGIVFQFFNLIPTLTVLENVSLPMDLAGQGQEGRRRAVELLARVGLEERMHSSPDKLSGGQQQRVAIARALVHDPLLVLADEPTGNLDEETGEAVLGLLLELSRDAGKTLILATHAADIAGRADQVLYLEYGKLVGSPASTPGRHGDNK